MTGLDNNVRNRLSNLRNTILWLWGSWFVLMLVKALQHQTMPVSDTSALSLALIVIHAGFLCFLFLATRPLNLAIIFLGGYFARLFTMIVDRFTTIEMPFLKSSDADGFFLAASMIAEDLSLAGDTYGGAYTAMLGHLFYYVGTDRLIGQYLNVILSVSTVVLLAGVFRQLRIGHRPTALALALAAFMPLLVVHSSILLREAIIQALVTAALLAFVKGLLDSNVRWTLLGVLGVLCASLFHAGAIGVLVGFVLASALTSQKDGRFVFGFRRTAPTMLLLLTAAMVLVQFPDLFLGKFQTLESSEDLLDQDPRGDGGAAYLVGLEIDSWLTFILYAPLRAFYFITSPLPWDWRGLGDFFAFGLDSIVYLTVVLLLFSRRITDPNKRYLAWICALVLLITSLIFGVGVSNSGTAIRHRGKLIGVFLVLLALIFDSRQQKLPTPRHKESFKKNHIRRTARRMPE